jgi:putative ABC transport system permease protein
VAYWGVEVWLRDYAYRVPMGLGVFVVAGVTVVGIALLTMGAQVLRAATANPARSIRTE